MCLAYKVSVDFAVPDFEDSLPPFALPAASMFLVRPSCDTCVACQKEAL